MLIINVLKEKIVEKKNSDIHNDIIRIRGKEEGESRGMIMYDAHGRRGPKLLKS